MKPDYNPHTLQNESFVSLQYSQLSEILKGITSSELVHEENYIYVEELIRHIDLYLTKVETTAEDIRKSDEVVNELVDRIKQTLDMTIYGTRDKVKYNCIQIWKEGWNTGEEYTNYKGLHYEILFLKEEFSNLCRESGVRIYFDIHNETARNRIPKELIPKKNNLYNKTFYFNTRENIEKSIDEIVTKMKEIIDEYDEVIDRKLAEFEEENK